MSSNLANQQAVDNLARNDTTSTQCGVPEPKIYSEDGWVFREYPGKSIECVGRAGSVGTEILSQPNLARHNYPSN